MTLVVRTIASSMTNRINRKGSAEERLHIHTEIIRTGWDFVIVNVEDRF